MNYWVATDNKGIFLGIYEGKDLFEAFEDLRTHPRTAHIQFDSIDNVELDRAIEIELNEVRDYHVRVYYKGTMTSFYSDEAPDELIHQDTVVWMPV